MAGPFGRVPGIDQDGYLPDEVRERLASSFGDTETPEGAALRNTIAQGVAMNTIRRSATDRSGMSRRVSANGAAVRAQEDGIETVEDWADLTDVTANSVLVSNNRVYGSGSAPQGAKIEFNPAGTVGTFTTVLTKVATGQAHFVGFAGGGAVLTSSTDGFIIGISSNGRPEARRGSGLSQWRGDISPTQLSSAELPNGDYTITGIVTEDHVSLVMRDESNNEWRASRPRSIFDPVGGVQSVLVYAGAGGLSQGYVNGVTTMRGALTLRTIEVAGIDLTLDQPRTGYFTGEDAVRLQIPTDYDPRFPRPLILWCHNASGTAFNLQDDARMRHLMTAFYEAGYPVCSATMGGQLWSNDLQRLLAQKAHAYAMERVSTSGTVLVGNSMGGHTVLNLLARNEIPNVTAALIVAAAVSLEQLYSSSTYKPFIQSAYGFTGDAEYATATEGYDPNLMPGFAFGAVPIMAVHSPTDASCDISHAADLIDRVSPYGDAVLVESTGAHMAAEQFTDAVTHGLPFIAQHS